MRPLITLFSSQNLKRLFYLLCLVLLTGLIVRERGIFSESLHTLGRVSPWWVAAGFMAMLLSVLASGAVYGCLSPKPLRYWRTVLVQAGGLGVNRLLPAGSGALGVAYLYLRAHKIGKAQAATVVTLNNALGFVGHALLLVAALLFTPDAIGHFDGLKFGRYGQWLVGAGVLVIAIVLAVIFVRGSKGGKFESVGSIFRRPARLVVALVFSMLITVCYATAVLLAAGSLGYDLSPAAGLIVLSFGVAAASAVPVPGGIGAAEAGIFAGMHAYGASPEDALAVALLYRVMTFWLPLFVGGIAFLVVDRRGYLRPASK